MKVLVTGGNGFLAANIVRELNRRGSVVRAMVRSSSDLRSVKGTDCEMFYGDIINRDDVFKAVQGCDVVIHAAANTSQNGRGDGAYIPVNVNGTKNVLDASVHYEIRKFIYVSSANAFGFGTKESPGNEDRPSRYPFTLSGYARSKVIAQELALEFARTGALDAVVVNPSFMIGPYDSGPSSGRIITMNYGKRIVILPPGGKNFVHVKDVATGICNAIERGRKGECYLLANENLLYSEFYAKLQHISGKKQYQLEIPASMVTGMGFMSDLFNRLGFKTSLTYINSKMICTGNYYSSMKAVNELLLPQTPIEQAIADALEWFGQSGYLGR